MASYKGIPAFLLLSFHIVTFAIYVYAVRFHSSLFIPGATDTFAGKWKFLTFWGLVIQTVYFGYSLLNDVLGSNLKSWDRQEDRSVLQRVRDIFVNSIVFPMGIFVVLTFWGLFLVNRELVFPKALDTIIPFWLNHVMHTTALPFLLIEKYFIYHHYPSRKVGVSVTVLVGLIYQLWILWIAYYADLWVYPVLRVLSWPGRLAFFAVLWVVLVLIYLCGEWFTNSVWKPIKSSRVKKIE